MKEADAYIGGVPILLRPHARARRLKLRFDVRKGAALLTLPPGVASAQALRFARQHEDWLKHQSGTVPQTLTHGATIPFRGVNHQLVEDAARPAGVEQTAGQLVIGGPAAASDVRLHNWLKKQARQNLTQRVAHYAEKLGQKPKTITVRDTRSRWGSCSSRRTLSFSWRLILAPPTVLDYVVAHEMAHLVEMNHSPAFWRLVEQLFPQWRPARRWLKSNGAQLLLVG